MHPHDFYVNKGELAHLDRRGQHGSGFIPDSVNPTENPDNPVAKEVNDRASLDRHRGGSTNGSAGQFRPVQSGHGSAYGESREGGRMAPGGSALCYLQEGEQGPCLPHQ